MSDNHMVERVKVLLNRGSVDSVSAVHPAIPLAKQKQPPSPQPPSPHPATPAAAAPSSVDEALPLPDEALQVLALAQRTAEDHIAAANRYADKMRAEAQAQAARIQHDAQAYADQVRAEADQVLAGAHAAAELSSRGAYAQAAEIQHQAELALAGARVEADRILTGGRDQAEQLRLQGQQRYEDAVGGLSIRREALQKQIEALEVFDADYRRRLTAFLQTQLRALWSEQPRAAPDTEAQAAGGPVGPSAQA